MTFRRAKWKQREIWSVREHNSDAGSRLHGRNMAVCFPANRDQTSTASRIVHMMLQSTQEAQRAWRTTAALLRGVLSPQRKL
jgi:hypothetical protein